MREKKTLMELRDAMMIEKSIAEQQVVNETERLLEKIKELEDANRDLNRKVAEVFDKDLASAQTQTERLDKREISVNTEVAGEIKATAEVANAGLSPIKGILKNTGNSPIKVSESTNTQEGQVFNMTIIKDKQVSMQTDLSIEERVETQQVSKEDLRKYIKKLDTKDSPTAEDADFGNQLEEIKDITT